MTKSSADADGLHSEPQIRKIALKKAYNREMISMTLNVITVIAIRQIIYRLLLVTCNHVTETMPT